MERHVNPEDSDLFALGALDGDEKQAFEAHVRGCAACTRELEAARLRVALLALAAPPVAPLRAVKESLMRQIRGGAAQEIVRAEAHPRWAWATPAFAVAAIVFACLASWLGWRDQQDMGQIHALRAQLSAAQSRSRDLAAAWNATNDLLGAPGTLRVALAPQPGGPPGRAGVLYNSRLGAVVYDGELAPAPANKSYQLWLVPASGAPVSLGVFSGQQPATTLTAHVAPGLTAKAFAVSVEPQGGSPRPTGAKVLIGAAG